jgi:hypothetical protein
MSENREHSARAQARKEADEESALERLRATSAALLVANQRLAQLPLMASEVEARRAESVWLVEERARLEERIASLQARLDAVEASRSWRFTAPLRRATSRLRGG